jgi:hypothetical protein
MEQTVSTIKAKRKQCHELQQALEPLEKDLTEQVLAEAVAALKQEAPLLQSIKTNDTGAGWVDNSVSYTLVFTNNATLRAGRQYEIMVSFGDEKFALAPFAINTPGYVFKHKKKATRVAVNEALVAWQTLKPTLERVAPYVIKRRCVELLANSE